MRKRNVNIVKIRCYMNYYWVLLEEGGATTDIHINWTYILSSF